MSDNESVQTSQGSGTSSAGTEESNVSSEVSKKSETSPALDPAIQKLIQASEDRVRTQYSKEIKAQQAMIEDLKKSQMTEAELRKYKESQLQERESALARKELELYAVDALKEAGLPGSLREFIIGKDAEDTKMRSATLKTEFQKAVEAAVQERFKTAGRDPGKSEVQAVGSKKVYTRNEIDELSKRAQDRNLTPKERDEIVKELLAAQKEGRIKL